MLLNIIFSFNRAMQLDYLLKSSLKRFKVDYEVVVIYHTTGHHSAGYLKLKEKYRGLPIEFLERTPEAAQPLSKMRTRLGSFLRADSARKPTPVRDNFKSLLESTLARSYCEFVMFNTDDGFWFDDFRLDSSVTNLIRHNPTSVSYRTYVGDNISGFPAFVKQWGDHYLWDYYSGPATTHWTYPFSVDGTIYHTQTLVDILRPVDYYNPVTLEGNGVKNVLSLGLFGVGLGPLQSQLVGTTLNRVATETRNPTIHIDPDVLNMRFLEGFRLDLSLPAVDNPSLVPKRVRLLRGIDEISLYEIDELGREIQENLRAAGGGAGGEKPGN